MNQVPLNRSPWPPETMDHCHGLNDPQRQAVETTERHLLILAGAGTGKTRVLTSRIAHLIKTGLCRPFQILAVTFTNKAANEMKERLRHMIGDGVEAVWLGTFHSISLRMLRKYSDLIGYANNFTIIDADDQLRLMKQILTAQGIPEKKLSPRQAQTIINRMKDKGLTPEKAREQSPSPRRHDPDPTMIDIYTLYQERLRILNVMDFGDLLMQSLILFTQHPHVLEEYQKKFTHILVDEYQDTNVAQYLWLRLLAQGGAHICCVGDDDQSIYAWRGAEVENILRFDKDFPGAVVIRLEQNYRSTPHILGAAAALIRHNDGRLGKTLWTEVSHGEKITVYGTWDGVEESRKISDEIEKLQRQGHSLNDIAILVRAGFQTREFEDRFIAIGMPYRVIGGLRFYERQEIRDALAYLRLINNPHDSLAFERIINVPRRGIGATSLSLIHQLSRDSELSLFDAAHRIVGTDELRGQSRSSLIQFLQDVERWRVCSDQKTPGDLARIVLDESGYTALWMAEKSVDAAGRLENLKEFVNALDAFDTLSGFLEHVSLVMDATAGDATDMVTIMSLHSAKGLEFDTVFLAGWEEGLFPHPRNLAENGAEGLEEERRLAYVGMTRAKRKAYIFYAANRRVHNQWQSSVPSRFIRELPDEHVDFQGVKGLQHPPRYGGFMGSGRSLPTFETDITVYRSSPFAIGTRVMHGKFGMGTVMNVDGDRLEVSFDDVGTRRVISSFLKVL